MLRVNLPSESLPQPRRVGAYWRRSVWCWLAAAPLVCTAALSPSEIYKLVAPSVWLVTTYDAQGKTLSTGSAVVIAPETLITNCHVLKAAVSYSVRQGNTSHRATLQHGDSERDLCQMQVPQMKSPPAAVQAELPVIGQRVYALGAPRGLEATLTDGLVSAIRRNPAGQVDFIQTSAPLSPGSSGGGLFDDQGRLVGITTSGVDGAAQNLNFARPSGMIADVPVRSAAELKRWQEKQAVQAVAAPSGASSTAASGYAAIDDLDAVPYLSANGRLGYGRFLERPTPRAFALAPNGAWGYADGFKPSDATLPTDPIERALRVCAKRSTECRLYAVNRAVVWTPPPPPTGSSLKVRKIPTLRDGASP